MESKNKVLIFLGKIQKLPFWPKLSQIWPKFSHYMVISGQGVKIFVKIFIFFQNRKDAHFALMNTIKSPLSPPLERF